MLATDVGDEIVDEFRRFGNIFFSPGINILKCHRYVKIVNIQVLFADIVANKKPRG